MEVRSSALAAERLSLEVARMVTTGYLERDVYVRDLKLHYQEWGRPEAPTILMLHGFGVSGHMFDEFGERMQDRYHLIAVDQRGHGDSDWSSEGDYSREAFVADLEGFRESLNLERFILMGHSMGGLNAVSYINAHPEHVKALVLVDVGPESAKEGVDNIVRFTRGPDELEFDEFVELAHQFNQRRSIENIRERMQHRLKPLESGKWTWKFDKRFRQQDNGLRVGSELTNDQTWQLFRDVKVPTLLVRGAESDVLTSETAERVAHEMPRARLLVVHSAGHSVPGDNPDEFTAAVADFLEDVEAGRFQPFSATEPPPLRELVDEHEARRKAMPALLTMILIAVGAATAIAGFVYVMKRRGDAKRKQRSPRARAAAVASKVPVPSPSAIDVEKARERAAALVTDLSAAGQRSVSRARTMVTEMDVERARQAAVEAAAALAASSRSAAAAAPTKVDRKKLKKQGKKAAKRSRSFGATALGRSLALAGRLARRGQKGRRKKSMWRS